MIEAFRKDFHSKLQKDKLSLMVGVVRAARSEEKKFNVQGFCICTEAFRRLYGVSKGFLSKCIDLKDSNEIPAHGNLGKSKPRPKSVALRNRLYQYIQDNGDTDPTSTSEKNVPTSLSRIDLLHIVNTDKRFSCSLCYKVLKANSQWKFRPVQKFAKCGECVKFKNAKRKKLEQSDRLELQKQISDHLDLQKYFSSPPPHPTFFFFLFLFFFFLFLVLT